MTALIQIIKRNLQILYNSKLSSLILVVGPIFFMLIAGAALTNNSLKNIEVGFYTENNSIPSTSFSTALDRNSFVVHLENSLDDCKQKVIDSQVDACIELAKVSDSNSPGVLSKANYAVILHVDLSRQRTVWGIINGVQRVVDEESEQVRNSAAGDLKSEITTLSSKISTRRSQLVDAKSQTQLISNHLDEATEKFYQYEPRLNELYTSVNGISSDLYALQNSPLLSFSLLNSSFSAYENDRIFIKNRLDSASIKIENSKQEINSLKNTLSPKTIIANLNQARDKTQSVNSNLGSGINELDDINDDLETVQSLDIGKVAHPIPLIYKPVSEQREGEVEQELEYLDYIFPSFLMIFILFVSSIMATALVIRERISRAYIRNVVSRVKPITFLLGNFITGWGIILIQAILILLMASFFLNISIISNIYSLTIILFIAISFSTILGTLIGYIFHSEEGAFIASISTSLILLIFVPIITPTETLPSFIGTLVGFLPPVLLESKLRLALFFGISLKFTLAEVLSLILCFITLLGLLTIFIIKNRDKEI